MLDFFHNMRFGAKGDDQMPYSGIDQALTRSTEGFICQDETISPLDLVESAACMNAQAEMYLFIALMMTLRIPLINGDTIAPAHAGRLDALQYGPDAPL